MSAPSRTILLLSFTGILFCAIGRAQPGPVVYDTTRFISLGPSARFLTDTLNRTIEEIAGDTGFREIKQPTPNFGFTRSAIWARCTFLDSSEVERNWVLEAGIPSVHHVTCYYKNRFGRFDSLRSGLLAPFSRRPLPSLSPAFPLPEKSSITRTVYLRFSSHTPLLLPLGLYSERFFSAHDNRMQIFIGFYLGALFIMALYHLYLFASLKDRSYLYFTCFILLFALGQITAVYGFTLGLVGDHFIARFLPFTHVINFGAALFAMLFSRAMIASSRFAPKLDRLIQAFAAVALVLIPLSFVLDFMLKERLLVLLNIIPSVTITFAAIRSVSQGYRPAAAYLSAAFVTILGLLIYNLMYGFNVFPFHPMLYFVPNLSFLTTIVLFSIGLADRINSIKRDRERASALALKNMRHALSLQEEKTLLEQELSQARKMEALGRLVGGISHDLKNMLTPMYGYAELIRRRSEDNRQVREFCDHLLTAAGRARELTGNLLSFSHKKAYARKPVNLEKSITNVIDLLKHSASKDIELCRVFTVESPHILGDAAQIEYALLNLGLNARDAIQGGSGRIVFETGRSRLGEKSMARIRFDAEIGEYFTIVVRDTGAGMEPDVVEHIFEPFFTTKKQGKGTGLGLAGVYGCVKNHKGCIEVESTPGEGSLFKLHFPGPKQQPDKEEIHSFPISSGKGKILVVDDEEYICEIAREILVDLGYSVDSFTDAHEALEHFRANAGRIDAVLLDMMMPGMRGDEWLKKIRVDHPTKPVIIMTGYSEVDELAAAQTLGISTVLEKPFEIHDLSRAVTDVLRAAKDRSSRA